MSEALRVTGLTVWDPEVNLHPGDDWAVGAGRALEQAVVMVVLL